MNQNWRHATDLLFDAGKSGNNFAMFIAGAKEDYDEPKSYHDAWDNPDPAQKTKWQEAISKELQDMKTRKVWKTIKRSEIPEGGRCVKHRWVRKIKKNGIFRARCAIGRLWIVKFQASIMTRILHQSSTTLHIGYYLL
jgi:hypothetical protein